MGARPNVGPGPSQPVIRLARVPDVLGHELGQGDQGVLEQGGLTGEQRLDAGRRLDVDAHVELGLGQGLEYRIHLGQVAVPSA